MKINKVFAIHAAILGVMCVCFFNARTAWAGSISETYKYAWSENSGWHNWHASNGDVAVESTMPIRLAQARLIPQDSRMPAHLRKGPPVHVSASTRAAQATKIRS